MPPGSLPRSTRWGAAVLFVVCAVVLVVASVVGLRAATKLQDSRARAQLASDDRFQRCLLARIDNALPAGRRVAVVGTDPLWAQLLVAQISPRVDVVGRADDADYTLQLTGELPGVPCHQVTIAIRRVQ